MQGFFHTPDDSQYIFGMGQLGGVELQPDGQWDAYLPSQESQLLPDGNDTFACASFGTEHCITSLIKRLYKV